MKPMKLVVFDIYKFHISIMTIPYSHTTEVDVWTSDDGNVSNVSI